VVGGFLNRDFGVLTLLRASLKNAILKIVRNTAVRCRPRWSFDAFPRKTLTNKYDTWTTRYRILRTRAFNTNTGDTTREKPPFGPSSTKILTAIPLHPSEHFLAILYRSNLFTSWTALQDQRAPLSAWTSHPRSLLSTYISHHLLPMSSLQGVIEVRKPTYRHRHH